MRITRFALIITATILFYSESLYASAVVMKSQQKRRPTQQQVDRQHELLRQSPDTNPHRAPPPWYGPDELERPEKESKGISQPQSTAEKKITLHPSSSQILASQEKNTITPQISPQATVSPQDLNRLIYIFDQSSEAWQRIGDPRVKSAVVSEYMNFYRESGIVISKPAMHYVMLIDTMSQQNPEMLSNPLDRVLFLTAVMEYDFDNGENRDLLARKYLGEKVYQENRHRLGLDRAP